MRKMNILIFLMLVLMSPGCVQYDYVAPIFPPKESVAEEMSSYMDWLHGLELSALEYEYNRFVENPELNSTRFDKKVLIKHEIILRKGSYEEYYKDNKLLGRNRKLSELKQSHPDIIDSELELILDKKIALGMSEKALLLSWGNPDLENQSVGSWGVHKQFVYELGRGRADHVYVENGKVTSWQTSR